ARQGDRARHGRRSPVVRARDHRDVGVVRRIDHRGQPLDREMQSGSHERMLVAPLHRSALLLGRAAKEVVPTLVQSVILVAVTIPFGFRLELTGFLIGIPMLALFAMGLGSLSHALAIATRKNEWMFWMVQQTLLFPLMILSGMLLPLDDAPGWMDVLSKAN